MVHPRSLCRPMRGVATASATWPSMSRKPANPRSSCGNRQEGLVVLREEGQLPAESKDVLSAKETLVNVMVRECYYAKLVVLSVLVEL